MENYNVKDKGIELLAPVGSVESLRAAINAGADAVYLAGSKFGARKYAKNFSDEELAWAIKYAHIWGVKVYVAMNTLVHNHEIDEYFEMAEFLYKNDVDAIIVQDIGMLTGLIDTFPGLEVHASTQMTLHSSLCVKQMENMKVQRSVLARELNYEEVEYIKKNSSSELEVFTSGALCVSYSGQCLMSSLIGGRSGNRGSCAQSCRQQYELILDGKSMAQGYLLSTKDLQVTKKEKYYFDSLKIEGRLKRPEYIFAAVSLYRAVLDGRPTEEIKRLSDRLDRVFSRGFTEGILGGEDKSEKMLTLAYGGNRGRRIGIVTNYDGKSKRLKLKVDEEIRTNDELQIKGIDGNIVGARVEYVDIKGNRGKVCPKGSECEIPFKHEVMKSAEVFRTLEASLLQQLAEELQEPVTKVKISFEIKLKVGEVASLTVSDCDGNSLTITGDENVQAAQKVGATKDKVRGYLEKLGDTAYELDDFIFIADENGFAPASMLNALRRKACAMLDEQRAPRYAERLTEDIVLPEMDCKGISQNDPYMAVSVRSINALKAALRAGAINVYYENPEDIEEAVKLCLEKEANIYLKLPRIIGDDEFDIIERAVKTEGLSGVMVSSYGALYLAKKENIPFRTDTSFNVFNSLSFKALEALGAKSIALSHELTVDDIGILNEYGINNLQELGNEAEAELVIFGRIPVMVIGYGVAGDIPSQGRGTLKDGKGKSFDVEKDAKGRSTVYNADVLFNIDEIDNLRGAGVSGFRLDFRDESDEFIEYMVKNTQEYLFGGYIEMNDFKDYVRNYYGLRLTRGHLQRGVE